ncbi:ARM repeat-containing protein [Aulographum hederae CBS 113979]|uniref:ARM repeat-containing protein n=1 Tax=Aulographum hederae CBS 113979 TaxID=1176131 RepID=A0A6G1HC35_9PEZI|nr:ARM repeat-containing protein [Aulographum hederae CBS 113979]
MDALLAKLTEQKAALDKSKASNSSPEPGALSVPVRDSDNSSSSSVPITPNSDGYAQSQSHSSENEHPKAVDTGYIMRLQKELEEAKTKIEYMDEELAHTRIAKHTFDQAVGPPSEVDFQLRGNVSDQGNGSDQAINKAQAAIASSFRPPSTNQDAWNRPDVFNKQESADALSGGGVFATNQGIWGNPTRAAFPSNIGAPMAQKFPQPIQTSWAHSNNNRFWLGGTNLSTGPPSPAPFVAPVAPTFNSNPHHIRMDPILGPAPYINDQSQFSMDQTFRGVTFTPSRPNSAFDLRRNNWNSYPASIASMDGRAPSPSPPAMGFQGMSQYQSNPPMVPFSQGGLVGRLSSTTAEFGLDTMSSSQWTSNSTSDTPTYVPPVEPMNYRRLLDRNMSCNWKYIVDKIVCSNDQQASIFLQQKLKVGTNEQKYDIVEAIIAQAYPLMVNRFGNFLVQRCFEHGTPEQVIKIANAIRGNTLALSMDSFGCHVIQKAFDSVPEEYKAIMVHELLRRIPETVVHRYACHVWQKLFELRWSDTPPQIMKYVNEALRGMWHEVALGETGSLVVQNIFENCLEEDKRPCINEVLASIDVVAHGQFGNWCIQHICEHGAPADRSRAIDHILRFATEYSMDQYASKVIEKCLKIGGPDFLERYLERVCEARPDRPRMPLIDIAGDQFGNYLIQWILTHANPNHREVVATHVRKHMVSLRGSKYGSRVAMLCCNPAFATRPGPPAGLQLNRYNSASSSGRSIFGGAYR